MYTICDELGPDRYGAREGVFKGVLEVIFHNQHNQSPAQGPTRAR